MATTQNVFGLRSAAATAASKWLHNLADELDLTEWFLRTERILASMVFVDAFVYAGGRRTEAEQGRSRSIEMSLVDRTLAHYWEQPPDWEGHRKMRWSHILQTLSPAKRLIVGGAPGSGKSFLTAAAVVTLARESAQTIESRSDRLDDVAVPFLASSLFGVGKAGESARASGRLELQLPPGASVVPAGFSSAPKERHAPSIPAGSGVS